MTSKLIQKLKNFATGNVNTKDLNELILRRPEVKELLDIINEQSLINVEVRAGIAYCIDPRVKIIDYD